MRSTMVLCLLIGCIACFAQQEDTTQSKIVVHFDRVSLNDLLLFLNHEYHAGISFSVDLAEAMEVSCQLEENSLEEALTKIGKIAGIKFVKQVYGYIALPSGSHYRLPRRHFPLTGFVMDAEDGEAVPHALVTLLGNHLGSVCDENGKFTFVDVAIDTMTLEVSSLGYLPQLIRLDSIDQLDEFLDISLAPQPMQIPGFTIRGNALFDEAVIDQANGKVNTEISKELPVLGEPDIFRTIELLPGANAANGQSALSIRGSRPGQNLVLLDGFPLYHLDHFFGVFSTVNSDFVKSARYIRNPVDVTYGGRAGSVLDLKGKTGNSKQLAASASLSTFAAKASVEVPINENLQVAVFGRRSHTDLYQSPLFERTYERASGASEILAEPEGSLALDENIPKFRFHDLNAKVSLKTKKGNSASISFFRSGDFLDNKMFSSRLEEEPEAASVQISERHRETIRWSNQSFAASYSHHWNEKAATSFRMAYSDYQRKYTFQYALDRDFVVIDRLNSSTSYRYRQKNLVRDISAKIHHQQKITDYLTATGGIDVNSYQVVFSTVEREFETDGFGELNSWVVAPFVSISTDLGRHHVTSGFRYDYSYLDGRGFGQARVLYEYDWKPHVSFNAAFSMQRQFVKQVLVFDEALGDLTYWALSDDELPSTSINHLSVGGKFRQNGWSLEVDGYLKALRGVSQYFPSPEYSVLQGRGDGAINHGSEAIAGLDAYLAKDWKFYQGWISYNLMYARSRFVEVNNGYSFFSPQDQRHELNFVNMFKWDRYTFALNWIYGTGKPLTEVEVQSTVVREADRDILDIAITRQDGDQTRLPNFHRLDASASAAFQLGSVRLHAGLSVFNAYNRKNLRTRRLDVYALLDGPFREDPVDANLPFLRVNLLGITPSVFLKIDFHKK